jgi:glycosyltransferase involved in cell wall biosynthesis
MCQDEVSAARKRGRQLLRVMPDEFVFGYFGYVYPGKGVDTLMKAFRSVTKRHSHVRLLILGGTIAKEFSEWPGYAREMSELPKSLNIEDKVIWYGEYDWNSDEASLCLRAVDACVIPVDGGVQLNTAHSRPL